jgi:hypothetical protein
VSCRYTGTRPSLRVRTWAASVPGKRRSKMFENVRKLYKLAQPEESREWVASADHVTGAKWPAHCKTIIGGTDCLPKQLT